MDFTPGRQILQRYWLAILVLGLLAMCVAFAASYLVTPSYSATSHVLVHQAESRLLTKTGQDLKGQPGGIDPTVAKSITQTDSGLVTDRQVAEQVVRELGLDQPKPQDPALPAQVRQKFKDFAKVTLAYLQYGFYAEPDPFEGAVSAVQRQLEGTPIKDSYLIEIKAHADDPGLTAQMANSATRAFIDASEKRFQQDSGRYQTSLQSELDRANGDVQNARAAVKAYKEQNGISDISEQLKLSANDQATGRKQLADTDAALEQARAGYADLQTTLANVSPTESSANSVTLSSSTDTPQTVTTISTIDTSPSTSTQLVDPADSVTQTGRSMMTTHSPGTTTTTSVDGASSTTRNETTTTQSTRGQSTQEQTSVAPNKVYQDVQNEMLAIQAEIGGLQAKRDSLAASLNDGVHAAAGLPVSEAQLAHLQLQATAAETTYLNVRSTYDRAVLDNVGGSQEISLVDTAAVPVYPDKPLRYLFAIVGLLVGLVGGTGLGYVGDTFIRRRIGWDLLTPAAGEGGPVPGSIPQPIFGGRSDG